MQQTWPITWEDGQDDLKEIIEREIDETLFEEIQNGKKSRYIPNSAFLTLKLCSVILLQ